jgi:hypothetical protein
MALAEIGRNLEVIFSANTILRIAKVSCNEGARKRSVPGDSTSQGGSVGGIHTDEIVRIRAGTLSYSSSS